MQSPTLEAGYDAISLLTALATAARALLKPREDDRMRLLSLVESAGRRGSSQAEAARGLGLSAPATSRLCDDMETGGLVRRESHPNDRRVKTLHLTDEGQTQLRLCCDSMRVAIDTWIESACREQKTELAGTLMQIASSRPPLRACEGCRIGGC